MTGAGRPPSGTRARTTGVPAQARAKKAAPKKAAPKKAAPKKAAAKKLPAQKAAQAPARKVAARKVAAKKAVPAKRAAPAKKVAAKKAAPATRGVPAQKAAARKAPAKKAAARRVPSSRRPAPHATSAQRMLAPARKPRPRLRRPPRPGNPDGRIRFVAVAASVVLLLIVGRLIQVQVIEAGPTAEAAFEQRSQVRKLTAARGSIVDRNGAVLATTVERRNVTVDQRIVNQYHVKTNGQPYDGMPASQVGITGAANALAPLLNMTVAAVREKLTGDRAFVYVKKSIEPAVWQQVAALEIPGVYSESANQRNYPNGQVAASVIGFVGQDGKPLAGIERAQQSVLQGQDGVLHYERGSNGQQIPTGQTSEVDPVPGRKVQLTLDSDLQWKAQKLLADQLKKNPSRSAQAVVLNVKTGEVLALADAPGFDPNKYGSAKAENLQNRSLVDVFEPGSTSKVITAAAALEEGKATPQTKLTVNYTIDRGGRTFHDSHAHGTEKLTFTGVLAQSSNTGTIQVGERVPAADMNQYLRKFGLGSATGVGLPESKGLLAEQWNNSQRYTVLFGQGLSVTALQSAEVYATIANNGVKVQPRIVKAVQGEDGELVPTAQPKGTRVISAKTATTLRQMLESVVGKEGTGDAATIPGYRVAGKTGTADYYDSDVGRYNGYTASFVGMAPADDPEIVVAVFFQQPTNGYYGGSVAAPVFQKLMTYALLKEGVEPSRGKKPSLPLTWK